MHRITVICDDDADPEPYKVMEYKFQDIRDMERGLRELFYHSDIARGYELVPVTLKSRKRPGRYTDGG